MYQVVTHILFGMLGLDLGMLQSHTLMENRNVTISYRNVHKSIIFRTFRNVTICNCDLGT